MAWFFATGATCFALGSVPFYFETVAGEVVAVTFFVGSLFFTTAAYIQYYLAINAGEGERHFVRLNGLTPDMYASGIQLVGTLFFNISTLAAVSRHRSTEQANVLIWIPDVFGSTAFLLSSLIAVWFIASSVNIEASPRTWSAALVNLFGSIAFGVSALAAIIVPTTGEVLNIRMVNLATFTGAALFFVGAILSLPRLSK